MATEKELLEALRRADAAGDKPAAEAIVRKIIETRGGNNASRVGDFKQRGDKDLAKWTNPAYGESSYSNAAAGAGKAMYDSARGIGQLAGTVSEEDVLKSRQRDAALMKTTAGQVGNVGGYAAQVIGPGAVLGSAGKTAASANMLKSADVFNKLRNLAFPSSLAGNMAQGAGLGFIQPTVEGESRLGNAGVGALAGGVGYMIPGLIRSGKAAFVDPMTDAGNERIIANALQNAADDPRALLNPQTSAVPGYTPTLAEATLDPGIAQLQRALVNSSPVVSKAVSKLQDGNNLARVRALESVAGDVGEAVAKRAEASAPLYEAARAGVAQMDDAFRELMKRPSIKEGLRKARKLAAEAGEELPEKPEQFTGAHLQYVDQALSDQIGKATTSGAKGHAKQLIDTQMQLRDWMAQSIPEYDQAQAMFRGMSREVDQAKIAEEILRRAKSNSSDLTHGAPKLRTDTTKGAIKNLDRTAKGAGVKGDPNAIMTAEQKATLDAVAESLDRMTQAETAGMAARQSATAQNLAGMNALSQLGLPSGLMNLGPVGRLASVLESAYKVAGVPERLHARLAEIVVNPAEAQRLVARLPANDQRIIMRALNTMASQQAGAKIAISASPQN